MKISTTKVLEMYATMTTKDMREALGGISQARLYSVLSAAGFERKRTMKPRIKIELVKDGE